MIAELQRFIKEGPDVESRWAAARMAYEIGRAQPEAREMMTSVLQSAIQDTNPVVSGSAQYWSQQLIVKGDNTGKGGAWEGDERYIQEEAYKETPHSVVVGSVLVLAVVLTGLLVPGSTAFLPWFLAWGTLPVYFWARHIPRALREGVSVLWNPEVLQLTGLKIVIAATMASLCSLGAPLLVTVTLLVLLTGGLTWWHHQLNQRVLPVPIRPPKTPPTLRRLRQIIHEVSTKV